MYGTGGKGNHQDLFVSTRVFAWVHESSILDSQMLLIIFIQKYLFMQIYTSTFLTFSFTLDLDCNSFNLKKVILSEYNSTKAAVFARLNYVCFIIFNIFLSKLFYPCF